MLAYDGNTSCWVQPEGLRPVSETYVQKLHPDRDSTTVPQTPELMLVWSLLLLQPWDRAQPAVETPPAFAQQASPAPWQRDASPPQTRHQAGRAGSVASSVSDAAADEVRIGNGYSLNLPPQRELWTFVVFNNRTCHHSTPCALAYQAPGMCMVSVLRMQY